MTDRDISDVEKGLTDLFKYAFTTNCELDEASMTSEEARTLEELDILEILENFKDLVVDLLNFKKNYKSSDKAKLTKKCEQFENMLQKLESDVRKHIRVEHQLKLHIDTTQSRVDELEKINEKAKKHIAQLEGELAGKENNSEDVSEKLKNLENKFFEELQKAKKDSKKDKLKEHYDNKVSKLMDIIEKREKQIQELKSENSKLRSVCDETLRQNENLKKGIEKDKKIDNRSGNMDNLKKKLEEKAAQLNSMQKRTFLPVKSPGRKPKRCTRRSMGEVELRAASTFTSKKEDKSKKRSVSRRHMRSYSDYTQCNVAKRTPSR